MRTSLTETEQIEQHLHGTVEPGDALVFQARLLLQPDLRGKVQLQQQTYQLVQQYGRKQLRAEIEAAHQKLFNDPLHQSYRQKIIRLFTNR